MGWIRAAALLGALFILAAPRPAEARRPDPAIATLLSLGSTLLPVGTGLALLMLDDGVNEDSRLAVGLGAVSLGASVGPSVGQWYGGGGGDAWTTFLLRTLTTGMMSTGIAVGVGGDPDFRDLGTATAILGGVVTGVLGVYDIATAGRTARQTRRASGFAAEDRRQLRELAQCGPFPCSARVTRSEPTTPPSPTARSTAGPG